MDNFLDIILFIIIFYLLYLNSKCNAKLHKLSSTKNDDAVKQEYIVKQVKKMKLNTLKNKYIHLIQAGSEYPQHPYQLENFNTISRPLSSLNDMYEQYPLLNDASDIKNNRIKSKIPDFNIINTSAPEPVSGPSSAPVSSYAPVVDNIIGVTHAPMFAPIESVYKTVDIFLFNQINQSVNNSFAYIDSIIPNRKTKLNNNESIKNEINMDNVVGIVEKSNIGSCKSTY